MRNYRLILAAPVAALLAGTALPGVAAYAAPAKPLLQEEEKEEVKTRKVKALRERVYKKIQNAEEEINELLEEDPEATVPPQMYRDQLAELEEILTGRPDPNEYERAVIYQKQAGVHYQLDDTPSALDAFLKVLELREEIPVQQEIALLLNVSQLYASIENYDKAIDYYEEWLDRTSDVSISQYTYGAQIYYTQSNYSKTIEFINKAIQQAEASDTAEVEENWYTLRFSSEWELKQYAQALKTAEILFLNWPDQQYWLQMAQLNQEVGNTEKSYIMLEAAYRMGYLDDNPSQIVNTASVLLAQEVPIKAAWVLEEALRNGLIEDTARNQRMLGQSYYAAQEYDKAITPLSRAAAGDEDLEPEPGTWQQIAYTLASLERYQESVDAFKSAIELFKKELRDEPKKRKDIEEKLFATYQQMATRYVDLNKFKEAKDALDKAAKYADGRKDRKSIANWRDYVSKEEQRFKILAEATS